MVAFKNAAAGIATADGVGSATITAEIPDTGRSGSTNVKVWPQLTHTYDSVGRGITSITRAQRLVDQRQSIGDRQLELR
jgi:hypothetical protein